MLTQDPQAAAAVLMVRPRAFASNPETLASNHFQSPSARGADPAGRALGEFDQTAAALAAAGVRVHVFPGNPHGNVPDEVFPNNWLSLHADGTVVLYPMLAPSRRRERRLDIVEALRAAGYDARRIVDLTGHERHGRFLEGTGSMVLDRYNRVAYACLSPRTHPEVLADFGAQMGYEIVAFEAHDRAGRPIYHTNVLMSLGTAMGVVCAEAIRDRSSRAALLSRLGAGGRDLIELGLEQLHAFAGNLLELVGRGPVIGLSARAWGSLGENERGRLAEHGEIVAVDLETIETFGGGSLRCMLAEVHLTRKTA